ncbi:MAG: prepilin-type N-terminal cleavage/methylation domain-containing protein [Lactobacillales bacterium]|nr:prepilin-type N-terminal cleavage/methylation domain-containing protein [Lactobacillales bacterium]
MKQNKKGFTLIELLAVIVILAIIALIATPIILNMINDARESAAKDSAYAYLDAAETYVAMNMMFTTSNGSVATEYNVTPAYVEGGCDVKTTLKEGSCGWVAALNDTVKGTKPTAGTITYKDGAIADMSLEYGEYKFTLAQLQS